MKRVCSIESLAMLGHYKNLLDIAGIPCHLKNENLASVAAEVPFFETWPELWVEDDRDEQLALKIIAKAQEPVETGPDWHCVKCGADNEFHFGACWQCGTAAKLV